LSHYRRHFNYKHPNVIPYEYNKITDPRDPYCTNWKDVLENDAKPIFPVKVKGAKAQRNAGGIK